MKFKVSDIAEYIIMIVSEFAVRYSLTDKQAYLYICRYGGIEMIKAHYGIIHTLGFDEAVDAVATYCRHRGGRVE